jgi:hypothetical protein
LTSEKSHLGENFLTHCFYMVSGGVASRWERLRRHFIAAMLGTPAKRLTCIRKGFMLCAYREGDLKKLTASAVSAQRVS